jgi:hypothetical protein
MSVAGQIIMAGGMSTSSANKAQVLQTGIMRGCLSRSNQLKSPKAETASGTKVYFAAFRIITLPQLAPSSAPTNTYKLFCEMKGCKRLWCGSAC